MLTYIYREYYAGAQNILIKIIFDWFHQRQLTAINFFSFIIISSVL